MVGLQGDAYLCAKYISVLKICINSYFMVHIKSINIRNTNKDAIVPLLTSTTDIYHSSLPLLLFACIIHVPDRYTKLIGLLGKVNPLSCQKEHL